MSEEYTGLARSPAPSRTNNFCPTTQILAAWLEAYSPTLQELQQLRKNQAAWQFFCDKLLPKVISHKKHKDNIDDLVVSKFTDPSDIAFVLLVLENCWDQWKADPNSGTATATLWTATSRVGGQNTGWDTKAHDRYNELCYKEEQDREDNSAMETTYLTYRQGMQGAKKRSAEQMERQPKVNIYVSKRSNLREQD